MRKFEKERNRDSRLKKGFETMGEETHTAEPAQDTRVRSEQTQERSSWEAESEQDELDFVEKHKKTDVVLEVAKIVEHNAVWEFD